MLILYTSINKQNSQQKQSRIVLLICDANYLFVDIEAYSRRSNSGILKVSPEI